VEDGPVGLAQVDDQLRLVGEVALRQQVIAHGLIQPIGIVAAAVGLAVDQQRGDAHQIQGQRFQPVLLNQRRRIGGQRGAEVVQVQAKRAGESDQHGAEGLRGEVAPRRLFGEEQVVHRPEGALLARRLRRQEGQRGLVVGDDIREVPPEDAQLLRVTLLQDGQTAGQLRTRLTLKVAVVDDRHRGVFRPLGVVGRGEYDAVQRLLGRQGDDQRRG